MSKVSIQLNGNSLTPETVAAITAKINELRELLPVSSGLSARDRLTYPALASKGTQFVQKAVENMRLNPTLVPAYIDLSAVESSYNTYNTMLGIVSAIQQLERLASDVMHIAGYDARSQSLEFYNSVKRGSKANVPGAQAVLDNLKTMFGKTSRGADLVKNVKVQEQAPE